MRGCGTVTRLAGTYPNRDPDGRRPPSSARALRAYGAVSDARGAGSGQGNGCGGVAPSQQRSRRHGGLGSMDTGDTAWMLMSTALVMIMLPGLALFYGGLVRRKNVLSTVMHSFFGLALVSIVWV